jgi:hypothetical protein
MIRGNKTTVGKLTTGDRFYKARDRSKQVYGVIGFNAPDKDGYYTVNCHADGYNPKYPTELKDTTVVIFLRNQTIS